MLTAKNLVGRPQAPPVATPEPAEVRDLAAELATAQAELEAAQQAQSELYAAAQKSKETVVYLTEGVRSGESMIVDGEDVFGADAFHRAKANAEYAELKIEAGVRRLHAATMRERRARAAIFASEVAATLPALDDAIDAAIERTATAADDLRAARDDREQFIVATRQRASNLASPEDHVVHIGLAGLRVAGVKIENRDVAAEAYRALEPTLSNLQSPLVVRGTPG